MRPRHRHRPRAALLAALLVLACGPRARPTDGVVVTVVQPEDAAARAGIQVGDILLSFERAAAPPTSPQAASGPLSSCFSLNRIEIEEAPRGPMRFSLQRGRRVLTVEMPLGSWGLRVMPRDPSSPAHAACEAVVRARQAGAANDLPRAAGEYRKALAAARLLQDPLASAWILINLGVVLEDYGDAAGAEKALYEALAIRRKTAPDSLVEADSWHSVGYLEMRKNPERARAALNRSLHLLARHAPQSLGRAQTLNVLGMLHFYQGDFARAQKCYEQSLSLVVALRPGTDDEAHARNNLGLVARESGDPALAERYFEETAAIFERIAPESRGHANVLYNLGLLAQDHGDYVRADRFLRVALAQHQKMAPESAEVATILVNLGMTALDLKEVEEARDLVGRSLVLERRLAPGGMGEAKALNILAKLAVEASDLDEAERLARQALAIRQKQAPESRELAGSYVQMSALAVLRGDLARGGEWLERGLACRNLPAGSPFRGMLLYQRGDIALRARRFAEAEKSLGEALAIRRRFSPQSYAEAETLWRLATLYHLTGRMEAAQEAFASAAAAFEAQIGRLPDADEVRSTAGEGFADLYRDLVELQVRRGRPEEALGTLERSRGRSLLAALAQRDLAVSADLPPALRERQRQIDRQYEGTQELLAREGRTAGAAPADSADRVKRTDRIGQLSTRLAQLRGERSALTAEIYRQSPRYASLRFPQPLTAAGIAASLEPGTVLLAYSTGQNETQLFVVSAAGGAADGPALRVFSFPVSRDDLTEQVSMFRSLLLRGGTPDPGEAWVARGQRLYELLIAPAAAEIGRAERLLVSADGPLLHLPFAALVRPGKAVTFLIEEKPLHSVLSATLYAELRRLRRPAEGPRPRLPVVVFADPFFGPAPAAAGKPGAGAPVRRFAIGLPPLPGARLEAQAISALFGPEARVWSGREATEARVKQLPHPLRYVHFATHALLDPRFPLDSALAFSVPAGRKAEDNGLLQAWEIFGLRLDADLVTLSACDTGRGRDAGGEGLIGLTRAFQYAGARSIVASLWEVGDRSSARLMERFYTELRAGAPKDRALQRAQILLLRQADGTFAHPYHWAAFGLSGDWR